MMPRPPDEPGWTILRGEEADREWGVKIKGDQFLNVFGHWSGFVTPGSEFKPEVWYRRKAEPTELNHFI